MSLPRMKKRVVKLHSNKDRSSKTPQGVGAEMLFQDNNQGAKRTREAQDLANNSPIVQRLAVLQEKSQIPLKNSSITSPEVIQGQWTDENGQIHGGNPPPGWVRGNNNVVGVFWYDPGGQMEESSGNEEEFEPDSSEEKIPKEELYVDNTTYRSGQSFYKDKERDTRQRLMDRQTSSGGQLHSGFHGKGAVIPLDSKGREIRTHKTAGAENKQPDIDHIQDWIAIDEAVEEYSDSDLSSADEYAFKNHLYNVEDNLEILAHDDHLGKKRTTREKLTKKQKGEARKFVKEQRGKYKQDKYAQKKREARRKRQEKLKKKRNQGGNG